MNSWYQAGNPGGMEAMNRYVQHLADLQNPALQAFWQQVWARQMMCLRSLQGVGMGMRSPRRVDLSAEMSRGMMGPGMGDDPASTGMATMSGAQEIPAETEPPEAQDPPPLFRQGEGVVPIEPHAPEHRGRVGQVVQVVTDQPFYAVDFGTGHPHKWYAQSELRVAPPGLQAGEEVGE